MTKRQSELFPELPSDKKYVSDYPDLVAEWHPTKNGYKHPDDYSYGSGEKVWWQCSVGHEWKAVITNRVNGTGCPFCSGNKPSPQNNILSCYPDLAKEWHPTRNNRKPQDYTIGSNQKVWWKCNHGHEYKTEVHRRTNGGGCPECFNANRSDLMRPKASAEDNLAVKNPTLCLEWDYEKNKKPPEYYLPGSSAVVWWVCKNGDDHKWKARIGSRADIDDGILNGCPFCAGRKPSALHNLEHNYPNVASEWNYKLNNKLPNQYTPSSNIKVWWICEKGHEWETPINNRTAGRNCPTCSNKSSRNEIRILTELKALFSEVLSRYKFGAYEVDIFVPELNVAIEYDGRYWHRNSYDKDIKKQNKVTEKGVKLLRVREEPLPKITEFDIFVDGAKPLIKSDLDKILNSICSDKEILKSYSFAKGFINEQDYKTYLDYFPNPFPDDSLAKKSPEVAKDWHPTKNSPLSPLNFSPGAGVSVWWQCEKGHEWKSTINNRSKRGCPYCAGRYATNETCMAVTHPDLAKLFHSTKNGNYSPENLKAGTGIKLWWQCEKGHEWKQNGYNIKNIKSEEKCPHCRKENQSN